MPVVTGGIAGIDVAAHAAGLADCTVRPGMSGVKIEADETAAAAAAVGPGNAAIPADPDLLQIFFLNVLKPIIPVDELTEVCASSG